MSQVGAFDACIDSFEQRLDQSLTVFEEDMKVHLETFATALQDSMDAYLDSFFQLIQRVSEGECPQETVGKLGPPPGFPAKTNLQVSLSNGNVNVASQDQERTTADSQNSEGEEETVNDPQDPQFRSRWEYAHNTGHATTGSWENAHDSCGQPCRT